MTDRLHQVDLCPDCGGLLTAVLEGIDVENFTVTYADGRTASTGPTRMFICPAPTPCDHPRARRG